MVADQFSFNILFYSPIMLDKTHTKPDGKQNPSQLERAKTIKVGNIRWPPDKPDVASTASMIDARASLTIERTKYPDPDSQSQFMTASKIAAAQQELMMKIGPKHTRPKLGKQGVVTEPICLQPYSPNLELDQKGDSLASDRAEVPVRSSKSPVKAHQAETNLLLYPHFPCLTYVQKPEKLMVKKELFFPHEPTSDATNNLIFQQILSECESPRSIRLRPKDLRKLEKLVDNAKSSSGIISEKRKTEIVQYVQDNFPFYFMKFFPLMECENAEFIGISLKQVILAKVILAADDKHSLQAMHVFPLSTIIDTKNTGDTLILCVNDMNNIHVLTHKAEAVVKLMKLLIANSLNKSNREPLIFNLEKKLPSYCGDNLYGDVSKSKPVTQIKREATVRVCPTHGLGSSKNAKTSPCLDTSKDEFSPKKSKGSVIKLANMDVRHSDFAQYFHRKDETPEKQGFLNPLRLVASKAVSLPDVTKLRKKTSQLRWNATPLKQPILTFKDVKMAKLAMNCHAYILSFMGDYSAGKHIRQKDLVANVLKAGLEYKPLQDEIYCQLIMQTNQNKSSNSQSCLLGWRLFSLVSTYFSCTDMLRPYVFKHLQSYANAKGGNQDFSTLASLCLQVIQKAHSRDRHF